MATPEEDVAAKAEQDRIAAEAKAVADAAAEAAKKDADKLGEGGKAALDAERKLKRDAEARAKAAEAKLKELEDASLSETEKLKKEAEDGRALGQSATDKLRKVNLILALADQGLQGSRAKAAAKLIDGVEYDDDDEPKNLDDALKAAKAEYGEDMFKGARVPAPNVNGGEGSGEAGSKAPDLTADELAIAESFKMTPEEYQAYKDPSYSAPPKAATS